jgi:hypothetical protein
MQLVELVHETLVRFPCSFGGLWLTDHFIPSHDSASVPPAETPTASQLLEVRQSTDMK